MKTQLITLTMVATLLSYAAPLLAHNNKGPGVAPVNNPFYAKECSACHFAYQPGLMPARSWQKIIANLDDHFGENAELKAEDQKVLTDYLVNNAAEYSKHKRSVKIMRSLAKDKTPLRITEIPYLVRKHDELSPQMVAENPEVKSISYCDKCHTRADTGSYSERDIIVPGYGNWEEYEHSSSFFGRIKQGAKDLSKKIIGDDD
ncbi:MAG TPA: cytochrome C [Gammaproteobacteria bacterium]|nr:cytochrome C [Gammaproteobacteria bacterium]